MNDSLSNELRDAARVIEHILDAKPNGIHLVWRNQLTALAASLRELPNAYPDQPAPASKGWTDAIEFVNARAAEVCRTAEATVDPSQRCHLAGQADALYQCRNAMNEKLPKENP